MLSTKIMEPRFIRYLFVFFICSTANLLAQTEKDQHENLPRTTHIAVDGWLGGALLHDAYLSPMKYGGEAFGFNLTIESPLNQKVPLFLRTSMNTDLAKVYNPAKSMMMQLYRMEGTADFLYRFRIREDLSFALGVGTKVYGGVRLHSSNVNNIANKDFYANMGVAALLAYRLPLRKFPAVIRLYSSYSSFGVGYRVGYAQSFYEKEIIDKGFAKALHFTHPGNVFYSTHLLSVDMPILNIITMRVGYRLLLDWSNMQQRVNDIFINSVFIGFSWESLWFNGRKGLISDRRSPVLFGNS